GSQWQVTVDQGPYAANSLQVPHPKSMYAMSSTALWGRRDFFGPWNLLLTPSSGSFLGIHTLFSSSVYVSETSGIFWKGAETSFQSLNWTGEPVGLAGKPFLLPGRGGLLQGDTLYTTFDGGGQWVQQHLPDVGGRRLHD